jgi:hypothetical protein
MKILFTIFVVLVSFPSYSFEHFNEKIARIGVQNGGLMYMLLESETLKISNCNFSAVYCPLNGHENGCNAMLSIALTAKTTSSKIYLTFDKDIEKKCTLTNISM